MMAGKFISIEGIDGCGKTTHLQFIAAWLKNRAVDLIITREPGGTALGEKLREIILHQNYHLANELSANLNSPMALESELLIVFAARAQHINEIIKPSLAAGKWVISDRFIDSTYAYQGRDKNCMKLIKLLDAEIVGELQPGLTLFLDAPLEVCAARSTNKDNFEKHLADWQRQILAGYHKRAKQFPQRIKIINANQKIELVQNDIVEVLEKFYNDE